MKNLYPYHGKLVELALVINEKCPVTQDYFREYPIFQNEEFQFERKCWRQSWKEKRESTVWKYMKWSKGKWILGISVGKPF